MVEAIALELKLNSTYLDGSTIETIYFGGGTPSVLQEFQLDAIIQAIQEHFPVSDDLEMTIETNPDDISESYLQALKRVGFNRTSLGIQSFHEPHLQLLNRSHNAEQARQALSLISEYFDNYTADLIYGIPAADHHIWHTDIEMMLQFAPTHLSCYSLTIEEKTVFGNWVNKGKFVEASEDFTAEQLEYLMDKLISSGYEHYEISNFCKPGYASRHNSNYWEGVPYLGVGPGAHSFNGRSRQYNISNNALYLKTIQKQKIPATIETLTIEDQINERIMTGLRTAKGLDVKQLQECFQYDLIKDQNDAIEKFMAEGILNLEDGRLRLTTKGKFLADRITEELFLV